MTAAYAPDKAIAALIGRSLSWFVSNRPVLEREGFPKKDGLIGLTMVADVEAWIARRRVLADAVPVAHHQQPTTGEHYDSF